MRIRNLLLRDPAAAITELGVIVNREDPELQGRHAWTRRYGAALERWYYASLVLFGVGMIALVAVAATWP